ncbi:YceI family protein [Chelativorans sp. M5D2P16]|uniref:YceI family protein n=1 Tax=Chelativorans sp. M5D2P16 TaxID=3095678 RepID=UPI002ACB0418|nr:YceI family protein [Chelativorans sp. M5D2P16]MDZ5697357.1 YceI family protein [Chelativorans sp. M5D2P16]
MKMRTAFVAALLLFLASPRAVAAPSLSEAAGSYVIVPSQSVLAFAVPAVSGPGIKGRFARFEGTVDIPADSVEAARLTITIYPESVTTGQKRVDDFLKSDAVFDTRNERAIVFRSARVHRTGEDVATIEGNLTARGRTFRETFRARLADSRRGSLRFHVQGKVFRSRYGMDVGTPIYSNVVDFDMDLSVRRR